MGDRRGKSGPAIRGLYRRGTRWWFTWQVDGARQWVSLETSDEAEAVRRALEIRADPVRLAAGRWEFEIKRHLEQAPHLSRFTAPVKRRVLQRFAESMAGVQPAGVSTVMVRQWFSEELERVSASSANLYLAHVSAFFAEMVRARRLRRNPAQGVRRAPMSRSPRKEFVPAGDVSRLVEAAEDAELRLVLLLAFDGGLRKNEIVEARPAWLRRAPGALCVESTETFRPKNGRDRFVPLTGRLREALAGCDPGARWILRPDVVRRPGARWRWDPAPAVREHFRRHGYPELTLHDARRSFASNLASAGVSIYKVARWLGDSLEVTQQRYAHLAPTDGEIDVLTK